MATCLYCGAEFDAIRKHTKFCSHSCNCKYYRRQKAGEQGIAIGEERSALVDDRNRKMVELADLGLSCEEIKEELGLDVCVSHIQQVLRSLGVRAKARPGKKHQERLSERNAEIVKLRKQGHSLRQIAKTLGLDRCSVGTVCRRYGLGGVLPNNDQTVKDPKKHVESYLPEQYSYVSGYAGSDGILTIKHAECGGQFDISMGWIRNVYRNDINCPICASLERERKAEAKKREQEARAEERKQLSALRKAEQEAAREAKRRTVKCEICGKEFVTYRQNAACCSSECAKKKANRYASHRKDSRIADEKRIDKDISALGLFVRDGGRCWICGGKCDPHDYTIKDGYKICGNNYPSVDHVVPICEGGEDSWENVKLAHRICNTKRYFAEKVLDGKRVCT